MLAGIPSQVAEPVDDLQFDLGRAGRLHPRPAVWVRGGRGQFGQRRGPGGEAWDEREVPGVIGAAGVGQHVGEEPGEHVRVVTGLLGRRPAEPGAHLGRAGPAQHRVGRGLRPAGR